MVATTAFEVLARTVASRAHLPDAPIAVIEHPLGAITHAEVVARADAVVDDVIALFTTAPPAGDHDPTP